MRSVSAFRTGIAGQEGILGVLSLIIWTLTLLVTIKYLTFVTRADNQGEGGILALLALAFPQDADGARKSKLTILADCDGSWRCISSLRGWGHYARHFSPFSD